MSVDIQDGFCHAVILDGKGSAKEISFKQLGDYKTEMGVLWVHFDYTKEQSIDWITNKSDIDPIAVDALLSEITRPRTTILNNSVLLALRGINLNPNSDPEDMISIRLYINENIIISTKKRDLFSVSDILEYLKKGDGPKNSSEFLIELTHRLTHRMEDYISDLEDRASSLEELSIESSNASLRTSISQIKRGYL